MHTPSSAARAIGVAKATIYRAIKTGRLSAHKLSSGNYAIYPSEIASHIASGSAKGCGSGETHPL